MPSTPARRLGNVHIGARRKREVMNKIVKKHYPIERLPADLRSGLQERGWVHIEIEPEREGALQKKLSRLVGSGGKDVHGDIAAVLSDIRAMRE
jgi:hypothetical protein